MGKIGGRKGSEERRVRVFERGWRFRFGERRVSACKRRRNGVSPPPPVTSYIESWKEEERKPELKRALERKEGMSRWHGIGDWGLGVSIPA